MIYLFCKFRRRAITLKFYSKYIYMPVTSNARAVKTARAYFILLITIIFNF